MNFTSSILYQKNLDGVRGVAILLVMLQHQHLISFGWVGVPLFFLLSGYLITKILLKEKQTDLPLKLKLRNFWMRRVLRIFPVYYLYLFILLIAALWLGNYGFIHQLPYLLTYTYNCYLSATLDFSYIPILHLWSLSVEEQFYLFYPFIILWLGNRNLKICIIVLIVFTICFRYFYSNYLLNGIQGDAGALFEETYYLIFSHFDSFLLGASIVVFDLDKISVKLQNTIFPIALTLLLCGGLYLFINENSFNHFCIKCYLRDFGYYFENMKYQWPFVILNLFLFSLLLTLVVENKGKISLWVNKLFLVPCLVSIGKVSYGMYIVHLGISYLFSLYRDELPFLRNPYVYLLFYVLTVYMLALLVFHLFEKRFLSLKVKFR